MNYARLKEVADANPAWGLLDGATPTATAADNANAATVTHYSERMVTERSLYNELGPSAAEAVLAAIEGSAVVPTRAKAWVAPGAGGIDVGSAVTHAMLDAMQQASELTPEQVAAIKGIGEQVSSVPTYVGTAALTAGDVEELRRRNP